MRDGIPARGRPAAVPPRLCDATQIGRVLQPGQRQKSSKGIRRRDEAFWLIAAAAGRRAGGASDAVSRMRVSRSVSIWSAAARTRATAAAAGLFRRVKMGLRERWRIPGVQLGTIGARARSRGHLAVRKLIGRVIFEEVDRRRSRPEQQGRRHHRPSRIQGVVGARAGRKAAPSRSRGYGRARAQSIERGPGDGAAGDGHVTSDAAALGAASSIAPSSSAAPGGARAEAQRQLKRLAGLQPRLEDHRRGEASDRRPDRAASSGQPIEARRR